MPLYEYKCKKCGCLFEVLRGMNEEQPACPINRCPGDTVRLISKSSFKLKGCGFHNSDYTKRGPK